MKHKHVRSKMFSNKKSDQRRCFGNDPSDAFIIFHKIEQTKGDVPNDARNFAYSHSVDPAFGTSRNRVRPKAILIQRWFT